MKIPGLYDGTDKTFFMYNWEQIRSEVPFPQVYTVPTALERAGDFSQTRTADGRPITIYDPLTTRLVNGQYVRDAFPGNVIPASRIDPVALALLQRVPLPNASGLINNLLVPDNARADKYDQHVVKVDQVINAQPPLLRALRAQQAHRDQRLRGVPAGSLALVSARPHERRASPSSTRRCSARRWS